MMLLTSSNKCSFEFSVEAGFGWEQGELPWHRVCVPLDHVGVCACGVQICVVSLYLVSWVLVFNLCCGSGHKKRESMSKCPST